MSDAAKWQKLIDIMATLRGPNGCPWDKAQDHDSLRRYFLEETYEVLDAIQAGSNTALCDELGDVLLQVVFHARLAEEEGAFTIDDVVDSINNKMIRRHPHIFGTDRVADDPEAVLSMWEEIKAAEKKDCSEERRGVMQVNDNLPALMLAEKVQNKAHRVGFDWPDIDGPLHKLKEELTELEAAATKEEFAEELGDVLFAAVNLARFYDVDPEQALRQTVHKFIARFNYVEKRVEEQGLSWTDFNQQQLEAFYAQAKQQEDSPHKA